MFDEWEAGNLSDVQAARALASDYGELEDELMPLLRQRDELRDQLSRVVAHMGGKAEIPGFGMMQMAAPSITNSYDAKALDNLVLSLIADGCTDVAESITACRRQSMRAGSLRITREKVSK